MNVNDLMNMNDMYYVGNIVDVDNDGWYVLGNNRMIPVASQDAGNILITQLNN